MEKRESLSRYNFKYMGGYPGYSRRGTGCFKLNGGAVEFLFIGLKVPVTEKLIFPLGSITEIRLAREIRELSRAARIAFGMIGVILPLRLISIRFVAEGREYTAVFNELATERLTGGTSKAYRILGEAVLRKDHVQL